VEKSVKRHTFRSIISRFFASSSFFCGSSSFVSSGIDSPVGGVLSSGFCSVSVDSHRRKGRGDSFLELDAWMDRLALGLQDGVENDLEKEDVTDARLCLSSARRSMIRLQGVEGVEVEGKIFDGWMDRLMNAPRLQNFQ
jgi:hypothetical protein